MYLAHSLVTHSTPIVEQGGTHLPTFICIMYVFLCIIWVNQVIIDYNNKNFFGYSRCTLKFKS